MFNPLKKIEDIIYFFRDALWSYPNLFSQNSVQVKIIKGLYNSTRPYSHFVLSFLFLLLLVIFLSNRVIFSGVDNKSVIIEGVVIGENEKGELRSLSSINPFNSSSIQLERDLINLIYEPLYRFEYIQLEDGSWNNGIQNILTEDIIRRKQGADYEFKLKENIYWHTIGNELLHELNSDDVIKTFDIMSSLPTQNNSSTRTLNQLFWEKIDEYTIRVCTKPIEKEIVIKSCGDNYTQPILSNFLELLSFSIIPEHYSKDINTNTVDKETPLLFRTPVGTGPYKLDFVSKDKVSLIKNPAYHVFNKNYNVERIEFKLFRTLKDAIDGLLGGDIHSLAMHSTEYISKINQYHQINQFTSPVIYKQFWGIYFNLKKNFDGTALVGNQSIGDIRVRKAIASAINKDFIIEEALNGVGQIANGPIPSISDFYNPNTNFISYKSIDSNKLLEEAGWILKDGEKIRTNNENKKLSLNFYFVGDKDRLAIAEIIKKDLEKIGVELIIDKKNHPGQNSNTSKSSNVWNLKELNEQILAPRQFDMILYGVETFIDPDRYELYHSSQSIHPGLNISSYSSSELTVQKRTDKKEGESSLIDVPKVDRWLELAKSFDPVNQRDARKEKYNEIQSMIANDTPIIYLYHPQFLYYVNNDVKNVSLGNVSSINDRFRNIDKWDL